MMNIMTIFMNGHANKALYQPSSGKINPLSVTIDLIWEGVRKELSYCHLAGFIHFGGN